MTVLQMASRRKNSCTMAGIDWGGYLLFCTRTRIDVKPFVCAVFEKSYRTVCRVSEPQPRYLAPAEAVTLAWLRLQLTF